MLLDLPTELVVQIFFHLSPIDLVSCQLTSKYLHSVVKDSVVLQYHMALIGAKASDNPCSALPVSTKLAQLKNGEKAWAVLKPTFTTTIPVEHNPSGIYDLTGGVYLLGNHNRKDLHYLRLPSHPDEATEWSTIKVGRTIIDMGLCVYEHDLIAVVTTTLVPGTPMTYDIELMLFEFSTGKPHPQAQKHTIHVMNTLWEKPAIGIEIVGDHLVLILFYHRNEATPDDRVFIFEWKTAVTKTSFAVPHDTYTGLLFLSEDIILLPNTQTNALDIFRIPSTPNLDSTAHIPLVSLSLPQLAENRTVGSISCRAEPNPIGASSYLDKKKEARERTAAVWNGPPEEDMFPKRGYLASAEQAICIFALRVLGVQLGNFQFGHTFTFVVHRNALLDVVNEFERKRDAKLADEKETMMDLAPDLPLVSTSSPTESSATPSSSNSPPRIPWTQWGPEITRWFNSDSIPTRWITTTAGQRCVLIADSAPDTGFPYVVLDFNAESVRRMKRWQKARTIREKERERLSRAADRARGVAETREWAESSSEGRGGGESEDEHLDTDDDAWYDVGPGDEDDESFVHHTGMAIVDDEDFLETGVPEIVAEMEDVGTSSAGAAFSPMSSPHHGSTNSENDIAYLLDPSNEAQASSSRASPNHRHHTSQNEWAIEEEEEENATTSATTSAPDVAETPHPPAASADHPAISIERDPNNPLEGPDNTAARRIWCVTTSEMVEPAETFAERVEGHLPYVACASAQTYAFHGVLLDEERIIGIRTDFLDRIRQIEVHHFG